MAETSATKGLVDALPEILRPAGEYLSAHPVVFSLAIMLVVVILATIAVRIVSNIAIRLTARTRVHWDDLLVKALRRPVFWTLLFLGLAIAVIPLQVPEKVRIVADSIIMTILILMWSGFVIRLNRIILRAISRGEGQSFVSRQTLPLFENMGFIVILIIAIYLVFRSWHIDMTAWLASAGIIGIAIGFAAKDTLANLFSGVFILADTPYKIGDYVVLESGERGKVTHIGIRSTRLLTRDDIEITIPNAIMGNTRITNESGGPYEKFRIRVQVGVAYGSDIDHLREILMEIAGAEEMVCSEPESRVRFRAFGPSSLDFELLCWVDEPELRGRVLDVLYTTIYKRLNAEGIEIPYSKHDIFIKEMPGQNSE